jgi:hypothetical protein
MRNCPFYKTPTVTVVVARARRNELEEAMRGK